MDVSYEWGSYEVCNVLILGNVYGISPNNIIRLGFCNKTLMNNKIGMEAFFIQFNLSKIFDLLIFC
jgi:hypothetical protein